MRLSSCSNNQGLASYDKHEYMTINEFFKKLFSRMLVRNIAGIIAVTIALALASLLFINVYTHHGEEITVPNVCGVDQSVAEKKLEAMGLKMEVTDTGYVYNAAPLSVLEQSIKAGDKVKPGRIIYVTINSDGPRQIAIPDIADNCSRREAEDKLRVLGFKLAPTEYVVGEQPEWVIGVKVNGKSVTAGTKVSVNSPITLVVGKGDVEEEYNGNDSLDYILNKPKEPEIDEGEIDESMPKASASGSHEYNE